MKGATLHNLPLAGRSEFAERKLREGVDPAPSRRPGEAFGEAGPGGVLHAALGP